MNSEHSPVPLGRLEIGPPGMMPSRQGPPPDAEGMDWRRALRALARFKWSIVLVTLLGTGAGAVATRWLHPLYVAEATLWIDATGQPGGGGAERAPLLDPEAWLDLLRSYVVLEPAIRAERLYLHAADSASAVWLGAFTVADGYRAGAYRLTVDSRGRHFVLTTAGGVVLQRGTVGDSIGGAVGFRWAPPLLPPGARVAFGLETLRDAARALGGRLQPRIDERGNFLRVALEGPDPARVTRTLNAVVGQYVAVAAELRRERLNEVAQILGTQLAHADSALATADAAWERFRTRTITLPDEPGPDLAASQAGAAAGAAATDPARTAYFDLQVQRDQLEHDRRALEDLLAAAPGSGFDPGALQLIDAVEKDAELSGALQELTAKQAERRALGFRYTADYPPLARLDADIATLSGRTIPGLVRDLITDLRTREVQLDGRLADASQNLRRIPARSLEEARLRRAVTLASGLYASLSQRAAEARLALASAVPDVRVLDAAAVPRVPVKNTALRILLLAFVGSLGVSAFGAVLLDRVDPRVRYPEQVSHGLGLTILGAIPHVRRWATAGRRGAVTSRDEAAAVEALRVVSHAVTQIHGPARPLIITVTSPEPRDGKSFVAGSLAATFAAAGNRTLLIDADLRRGGLHRRFGTDRVPGLGDFLRGAAPAEAVLRTLGASGFTLVPCGSRVEAAPELLGTPRMADFIERARAAFDVILIDSPPLGAGVDAFVLGTLSRNLVVVLRSGRSHREAAAAKLGALQQFPVRLLGAVLNDIRREPAYAEYVYYIDGYETVDEAPAALQPGGVR